MSICDLTIGELASKIATREVSCVGATDACLERVARDNGRLNAFVTVLADQAREQAARADEELAAGVWRGPLHGVPLSLKDLIDLSGVPTTAGSRLLERHVATADALVAARLRAAGAVFLGKCNLHEFAFGTTSEDSAYGPVRNPFDPTRSAGGSSGGSAAAVVAGMGYASVGTDTGGSIRIPSAVCGCVGLKPTFGELPCDGIIPLSRSLDHVGPIARSVGDAWLLYHAMAGTQNPVPLQPASRRPSRTLRLGRLDPYFMDIVSDEVREQFELETARLVRAGVAMSPRQIPHAADTATVYLHIQLPEASAYHAPALERRPRAYTPPVRQRLELGRYVMAEDYVRARTGAVVLCHEVDAALDGCDALVLPTVPLAAAPIGSTTLTIGGQVQPVRALMLRLTQLFDITGHPAISLPCGRSHLNLPIGLQLVGRRHQTTELLKIAASCEAVMAQRE
ncbi:MAG TPA: amidase [Vicinamibacterales bacterium]|jgi:aspartyl-tRNA(Asn)/glutamyl-tRNA(Gln) amidotransferase subunit A